MPHTLQLSIPLFFSLVTFGTAAENIHLSSSFPKQWIAEHLLTRDAWHPFPRAAERQPWEALDTALVDYIVKEAEKAVERPIPALPATVYLQFQRNGNRSQHQGLYGERRYRLCRLVLGECVEGQGRFLDPIADTLWAICEESTWVISPHIKHQRAGVGLPDTSEPIVDMFAGETACTLAWASYLLRTELNTVSPEICRRIDREINARVLTPFLDREDLHWMGFRSKYSKRPNNWNPWINSNVLCTALLVESDPQRRVEFIHKALRSLDNFLGPHPLDGSCDEGPRLLELCGRKLVRRFGLASQCDRGESSTRSTKP